jgi:hypothetical protein
MPVNTAGIVAALHEPEAQVTVERDVVEGLEQTRLRNRG